MNRVPLRYVLVYAVFLAGLGRPFGTVATAAGRPEIIVSKEASWAELLAAREVRRYVYLRTGRLSAISNQDRPGAEAIIISRQDRAPKVRGLSEAEQEITTLKPQEYLLRTLTASKARKLLLVGGDDFGTLYGAYRLAEVLGVRFYLHGDVIPDTQMRWEMPSVNERSAPLFDLRGIQPFHDFPEGPDWWNRDDYLAVIGQLPKLRMNFFGLHTYPEERPNAEPTVWIGRAQDMGQEGRVLRSYPSSYQNTLRGNWGYVSKKTSQFVCGSARLFEREDFGPEVMYGAMPAPTTPEQCNEVFNRTGEMLRDAFVFARKLGVKTCVGTETPLIAPRPVQQRLKEAGQDPAATQTVQQLYEVMFQRVLQSYPLDFYWFWTPEGWTWSGTKDEEVRATMNDLLAAIAAHGKVNPPFALATCGWVLGPQQDRAMFDKLLPKTVSVSCINREVGKTPVEPGFADVKGRGKWAIPWMEDDPALTSLQLWVGRMRRDAADALRYGCNGLMGIHWRTHALAPNVSALAQAAWNQEPWINGYPGQGNSAELPQAAGPVGGQIAAFPNNPIQEADVPAVYQTVRYNLSAFRVPVSNGTCKVVLKFSEPHYEAAAKRVFDVKLQGQTVITNLDIFARVGKNRALDFTFPGIRVTNGWVDIVFVPRTEFPSIAGIVVESEQGKQAYNCGGPAVDGFLADLGTSPGPQQVYAPTWDFYMDWAQHEFGSEVGPRAAAIFRKVDCALPVPSTWTDGPGGIRPDPRAWSEARQEYAFVEEFAALQSEVKGAGNRERFDYWLSTFRYLRSIGEVNCIWAEFNRALEIVKKEPAGETRKQKANELALPARIALVRAFNRLMDHLLATVTNPGELGTVANWNQHNLPVLLEQPGAELAKLLEESLPREAEPKTSYQGKTRIILPTVRTSLAAGEQFKTRVIVLSEQPAAEGSLAWRALGEHAFREVPLQYTARGVYTAVIPDTPKEDFEYYLRVEPAGSGEAVVYPATAPVINQTVIRLPD